MSGPESERLYKVYHRIDKKERNTIDDSSPEFPASGVQDPEWPWISLDGLDREAYPGARASLSGTRGMTQPGRTDRQVVGPAGFGLDATWPHGRRASGAARSSLPASGAACRSPFASASRTA